jgi:hypothetical protein
MFVPRWTQGPLQNGCGAGLFTVDSKDGERIGQTEQIPFCQTIGAKDLTTQNESVLGWHTKGYAIYSACSRVTLIALSGSFNLDRVYVNLGLIV